MTQRLFIALAFESYPWLKRLCLRYLLVRWNYVLRTEQYKRLHRGKVENYQQCVVQQTKNNRNNSFLFF